MHVFVYVYDIMYPDILKQKVTQLHHIGYDIIFSWVYHQKRIRNLY